MRYISFVMRRTIPLLVLAAAMLAACAVDEPQVSQKVYEVTDTSFVGGGAVDQGAKQYFTIPIPDNAIGITVSTDGSGDVDLYTEVGAPASEQQFDCRPYEEGSSEHCIYLTGNGQNEIGVMVEGYAPTLSRYLVTAWWGISTSP
jgi:hypothetical protein